MAHVNVADEGLTVTLGGVVLAMTVVLAEAVQPLAPVPTTV